MADRRKLIERANQLIAEYQDQVISIEVVGSVRRGAESPGDLDLLICTNDKTTITLKPPSDKKRLGPYGYSDVFFCTPQTYGAAKVFATGPRSFNRTLRILAAQKGYQLRKTDGLFRNGALVPTITEQSLFKLLGVDWISAADRDTAQIKVPKPGTELARLFAEVQPDVKCSRCQTLAATMDDLGPDQCRARIEWLAEQIESNLKHRTGNDATLIERLGIRRLIPIAIDRSEGTPDTLLAKAAIAAAKVVG